MRKMQMARELATQYKGYLLYLFFGVATTAVNILCYFLCVKALHIDMATGNMAAWLVAVTFAYVTNRKWVFGSGAKGWKEGILEMAAFFGCRLATGMLDMGLMVLCVDVLKLNDLAVKCMANGIVILANYIAGKWIVFKK